MGHEPDGVDRVAVEAAADQVVHPAEGHAVERGAGDLERLGVTRAREPPQQEADRRAGRELGRAAEPAPGGVVDGPQARHRIRQDVLGERVGRRDDLGGAAQRLADVRAHPLDLAALLAPGLVDGDQHLPEGGHPVPRLRRVVGAAVERLAGRRQEHRHRPAAVAGHADDGVHVDGVQVGPLLAVDLHVHEQPVHHGGRLGVLERLVRHHVAPVAGRVADREQDRPLLAAGALERLVAPGVPLDRVLGVLEQVRAGLAGEPVHGTTIPARKRGLSPFCGDSPRKDRARQSPGGSGAPRP